MDMKKMNTFGIQFVIRLPKQQKSEMATVYARITVNGRRSEISLKSKVSSKAWDEAKGKAKVAIGGIVWQIVALLIFIITSF